MDGFGGYKTAATEALPEATAVMGPFHVVALAGAKLDLCRQRVQQATCSRRGRAGDPLYTVCGAPCAPDTPCSARQQTRRQQRSPTRPISPSSSRGASTSASSAPTASPTAVEPRP